MAIRFIGDRRIFVLKSCRFILAAALAPLFIAIPGHAQQVPDNGTVGAPELSDFSLPGTRTTPLAPQLEQPAAPADQTQPPPAIPPVTIVPPPPPVAQEQPAPRVQAPATQAPAPSIDPAEPLPNPSETPPVAGDAPSLSPSPPVPAEMDVQPAAIAPEEQGQSTALWIALGAAVLGLFAFIGVRRRGRTALAASAPVAVDMSEPAPVPAAPLPKMPAPAPVAALKAQVAARPKPGPSARRPWVEMEFQPDRMVATDAEAAVHFHLALRNTGRVHARNVRVVARMFNAGPQQQQEIEAFFAYPGKGEGAAGTAIVPHGTEAQVRASVALPREEARVYTVGGKPIFVPMVAVTILYDWDEFGIRHSGQTSKSYVVGVEAKSPSGKMGAFRLDLGPRIYRSVGQRQNQLARLV